MAIFCTHCGNAVDENSSICMKCGCSIVGSQGANVSQIKEHPTEKLTSGFSKRGIVIILGIAGVLCAFLAEMSYYLYRHSWSSGFGYNNTYYFLSLLFSGICYATSLIGLVMGIKAYRDTNWLVGLVLCLVGVFSSHVWNTVFSFLDMLL